MLGLRAQVLKPWVLLPAISHSKARSQLASISASFLEVSDSVEDRIFCRKVFVLDKDWESAVAGLGPQLRMTFNTIQITKLINY